MIELDVSDGFAQLKKGEVYWQEHFNWLLENGYRLRDRYDPAWVPSWKKDPRLSPGETEDSRAAPRYALMDAIRVSDDRYVMMKLVSREKHEEEVRIMEYFKQEPQHSDPRNRTVDLLDVLEPPDDHNSKIVVMPVLRPYDNPDFDTVGEGLDFLRQVIQGLCFLHEHRVAHRDIRSENILLDGKELFSEQYRAFDPDKKLDYTGPVVQVHTRTAAWPRYHVIDFGFSKQYAPEDIPPSEIPLRTTDLTVPEFENRDVPCNPFPIDVYTFGNLIRSDFLDGGHPQSTYTGRKGFEFLRPLVDNMTEKDPEKRVTMVQALEQFDSIVSKLGEWKLRSRPVRLYGQDAPRPGPLNRIQSATSHWSRKLKYVCKRVPPMPPRRESTQQQEIVEGQSRETAGQGDGEGNESGGQEAT